MLNVVSGYGPRVGSSFVMRQAKIRGLKVLGTKYLNDAPVAGNPGGYYDLDDVEVLWAKSGVAKVWARQIPFLRNIPAKMVVLSRGNVDDWLVSIDKQIKREKGTMTAEEVLEYTIPLMDQMLVDFPGEVMKVATESLNDKIEEILQFIGE